MPLDLTTVGMLAILAVLIFFMFRNGQKRKREAQALQSKVVAGADVMTNFGLYGTVLSIDDEENKVELETSPGHVLTIHRQTIARVVNDNVVEEPTDVELNEDNAEYVGEPEFGQRAAGSEAPTELGTATPETRDKKNDD